MSRIAKLVRELVEETVEKMDIELIDVEFGREGPRNFLRLYIDKKGGVSLDDCERVSKAAEPLIDAKDPIDGSYVFEVSSPGLDRPLKTEKDFIRYEGELVEVRLYKQLDGKKSFEGKLIGLKNGKISIMSEACEMDFDTEDVSLVKRLIKFD